MCSWPKLYVYAVFLKSAEVWECWLLFKCGKQTDMVVPLEIWFSVEVCSVIQSLHVNGTLASEIYQELVSVIEFGIGTRMNFGGELRSDRNNYAGGWFSQGDGVRDRPETARILKSGHQQPLTSVCSGL